MKFITIYLITLSFICISCEGILLQSPKKLTISNLPELHLNRLGEKVAISGNGTTIAFRSKKGSMQISKASSIIPSEVTILTKKEGKWVKKGNSLIGSSSSNDGPYYGTDIQLSYDGNTVVISGISPGLSSYMKRNSKGGYRYSTAGYIDKYTWLKGKWIKTIDRIDGHKLYANFDTDINLVVGWDVELSNNGNVLAFSGLGRKGHPGQEKNFRGDGTYVLSNSNDLNNIIKIELPDNSTHHTGRELALSGDGKVLYFTCERSLDNEIYISRLETNTNKVTSFKTKMFYLKRNVNIQIATNLDGSKLVCLYINPDETSRIETYTYKDKEMNLEQSIINFETTTKTGIGDIDLSDDGNTMAYSYTGYKSFAGYVEILKWDSNKWNIAFDKIEGEHGDQVFSKCIGQRMGEDIKLTANGKKIIIGSPSYCPDIFDAGKIDLYEL